MDYHIYLDGEKCGELTDAENARLRKEAKADARTWGAFVLAQLWGTGKLLAFFLRAWAAVGGFAFLFAMFLAPELLKTVEQLSAQELADAARTTALYLSMLAGLPTAALAMFAPKFFRGPDVFENEFLRRVRLLKNIRRYGQLEVIGFTLPRTEGEQ